MTILCVSISKSLKQWSLTNTVASVKQYKQVMCAFLFWNGGVIPGLTVLINHYVLENEKKSRNSEYLELKAS